MKKSRYTEEQIIGILKQNEAGVKTANLCREQGISAATFYGWKSKFGGMEVSQSSMCVPSCRASNRSVPGRLSTTRLCPCSTLIRAQSFTASCDAPRNATLISLAIILMCIAPSIALAQSAVPAQSSYSSKTYQEPSHGHYLVEVTSTSAIALNCVIQYAGVSFLDADRVGSRTLQVSATASNGMPIVRSLEFGGFRKFTATVNCTPAAAARAR